MPFVIPGESGDQLSGMDITVQKATTYKISGEIHAAPSNAPVAPARGRGANADPNAPDRIPIYLGLEYRDPTVIDMRSTNLGNRSVSRHCLPDDVFRRAPSHV
jgi:hypothetical protein